MRWPITHTTIALLTLFAAGCGSGSKVVPVSGKVTHDGQPMANVRVSFQPIASGTDDPGPGSYATTDAEGKFTLQLVAVKPEAGAVLGKHRVSITTPEVGGSDKAGALDPIPARYNSASELIFEVPAGGTDQANFDLK